MINVKRFHPDAQLPVASHPGYSLGFDIHSIQDVEIYPGKQVMVETGIGVQVINPVGYFRAGFLLRERSSMASMGIKLLGGVIDADYTGPWKVMLLNTCQGGFAGMNSYRIRKGDRIAQAIMTTVYTKDKLEWVEELSSTARGQSGFGSSGK